MLVQLLSAVAHPRSDFHHRWLTSREALLCQGFPVLTRFSYGEQVCSFAMDGYDTDTADSDTWRSAEVDMNRTARIGQAGNAMHSQCVGIVLFHIIGSGNTKLSDIPKADRGRLLPGKSGKSAGSSEGSASLGKNGENAQVTSVLNSSSAGLSSSLTRMANMLLGRGTLHPRK